MQVLTSYQGLRHSYRKICVGLGNFDGVHLGHQRIIKRLVEYARENQGTAAVFTFEPHPAMVLRPDAAPPLLLAPELKQRLIGSFGVDILLAIPFTREFALLSPEAFIREVLCAEIGVAAVFVGYNYTFGHRGAGTPETLRELGARYGFTVEVIPPVLVGDQPVSSTLIRGLIAAGKVEEAQRYLGYYPVFAGTVVSGAKRGTELGFPTANLEVDSQVLVPANGVYAVKAVVDGEVFLGVANIGVCPTFAGDAPAGRRVEVFLFDFHGDLYGKRLEVSFTRRLREERCFRSVAELVEQIRRDVAAARALAK
ncbi:riboflavin kinase/FMN adenylyltransferase [Thermodesulfitimonas autotrophica]|uniref:Riboflavin biosynthesis protein n=2 Tax=Thermodesulfitimonas autotrophica TaxID=1894989 RepID=A0A3N5BMC3_9THEO|nr:bifunctional riboflavin kinase/FAD synthetase [Thermodesulfitimonas autotrophica]RPF46895.1 riboflavin kinase/FMN adenylyltransferase [Thermodesulfitimonas autotrophica]